MARDSDAEKPTRPTPWCARNVGRTATDRKARRGGLPEMREKPGLSGRPTEVSRRCHFRASTNPIRTPLLPASSPQSDSCSESPSPRATGRHFPRLRKPGTPLGPTTRFLVPPRYFPGSPLRSARALPGPFRLPKATSHAAHATAAGPWASAEPGAPSSEPPAENSLTRGPPLKWIPLMPVDTGGCRSTVARNVTWSDRWITTYNHHH